MVDFTDTATRSQWMAGIRGRDTQPELFVRSYLHRSGLRFRLHVSSLPGRPDMVLRRFGTCIFVNGCFWHMHQGCAYSRIPKTDTARWTEKLRRNVERDEKCRQSLVALGWRVIDIWECGIKDVQQPDLTWLPSAIAAKSPQRMQWPARPRKMMPRR